MINFLAMQLWEVRQGKVMGQFMRGSPRDESVFPKARAMAIPTDWD
jgi:hypothetical protein